MLLRATIDTNVYISGLNYGGSPYRVIELARLRKLTVAVSPSILSEVERVLQRRFAWPRDRAQEARDEIRRFSEYVEPTERIDFIKQDPDDDRILECAVAANSRFIISGDKHLLRLGFYGPIQILSPSGFLALGSSEPR